MEHMECKFSKRCTNFSLEVKIGDNTIPLVTKIKYLGSIIQKDGDIYRGSINHRIQVGWLKWRNVSDIIYD